MLKREHVDKLDIMIPPYRCSSIADDALGLWLAELTVNVHRGWSVASPASAETQPYIPKHLLTNPNNFLYSKEARKVLSFLLGHRHYGLKLRYPAIKVDRQETLLPLP